MKKTFKLVEILVMLILLTVVGGTYAWVINKQSTNVYIYEAGKLSVLVNSSGNIIVDQKPKNNDEAIKEDTIQDVITITNNGDIGQDVSVYLTRPDKENDNLINSRFINVAIIEGDNIVYNGKIHENETDAIISFNGFEPKESKVYKIKYWINEDATTDDIAGKTCSFKVLVKAKQIVDVGEK